MNKVNYFRNRVAEEYDENNLQQAAEVGEALLREHWHNKNFWTKGYADDLYNLAIIYDDLGVLERAAELYSDSARQISSVEGEGLEFARRLTGLATVMGRMGIKEPAFFIHGQVTSICRTELGNRDPQYADSLYNLANAAADTGRRREALRYHMDALRIREQAGKTGDVVNSLHSVAFLYESTNEYEKAAAYAEAAMKLSDDDEESYASSCHYLAGIYEQCSKYEQALPLYDRVLEIAQDKAGREHSVYLNVAFRRANLLAKMNRPREALEYHEEVLEIFKKISILGESHLFYANCLRNMAILHKDLNETGKAEALMLESMKIRSSADEDIVQDIIFLIRLYLNDGESDKALEALIYALMRSDSNNTDFASLVNALSDAFKQPDAINASEIMEAMEALNDKSKLAPIINKWTNWESK